MSDRDIDLLARWRSDLASWAIPTEIIGRAAETPWGPEREVFIRRIRIDRDEAPRARPSGPAPDGRTGPTSRIVAIALLGRRSEREIRQPQM